MNPITLLEAHIVNQIAAGEVVERPASVLKELIENAIDAQATMIKIRWRQGGQSSIEVDDNGSGIVGDQIRLALARHATSKLQTVSDLRSIHTFGFRGEALAAMTSIARVTLTTRHAQEDHGWSIYVEAGQEKSFQPAARDRGTCVAVHDLFFATPARLKFMRSVQLEQSYLWDTVYTMALSHPHVHFSVSTETRTLDIPAGEDKRMAVILGHDFLPNSVNMVIVNQEYGLTGRLGLPTHHRANMDKLYIHINGRSVHDKMLGMAIRLAYGDTLPKGRYPIGWLSLQVPHEEVDVNVHPAKTEVRFLDPRRLKHWLQSGLHEILWAHGMKSAGWGPVISQEPEPKAPTANVSIHPPSTTRPEDQPIFTPRLFPRQSYTPQDAISFWTAQESTGGGGSVLPSAVQERKSPVFGEVWPKTVPVTEEALTASCAVASCGPHVIPGDPHKEGPEFVDLGQAIAQIHQRYIVAKTATHLILVDQHAAHERIVYEYVKHQWKSELGHVSSFLIPTQWTQDPAQCELIDHSKEVLKALGFSVMVTSDQVMVHSIPMIFQAYDPKALLLDLMSCVHDGEDAPTVLVRWRNHILANWSCRHSIRGGDTLSIPGMNALLRELEKTPNGAQCNHGRCVYRQWSSQGLSQFFQ